MKRTNIILTIIVIIFAIILAFLTSLTYKDFKKTNSSNSFYNSVLDFTQKNSKKVFSIDKITYFSSSNANISTNSNSVFTISDLYQYTDIAIFINRAEKDYTNENTLKSVELNDINFSLKPAVGNPNLYYKSLSDFATPKFQADNLITDELTFNTTSEDEIDYSTPTLYNNCANPITLCYVNSNIKDKHTLFNDVSNISYNGSLLKTCNITLNSISCKIDFVIKIVNNLDETFVCPLSLNIPLSTESSTIYDGSLTLKDNTSYEFIKI